MSIGELMYDISRYDPSSDTEVLVERAQLLDIDGALWRRSTDGSETRCSSDDVAVEINADPMLSEVRADQVTRIAAGAVALRLLPLLLRLPGEGDDFSDDCWPEAMYQEHLQVFSFGERNVFRVLYVNGERWGWFATHDGVHMLPDKPEDFDETNGQVPSLKAWGELTFGESASRTYGLDSTTIGFVTPGVVVCTRVPDEGDKEIRVEQRADDDVETFLNWLFHGTFAEDYFQSSERGEALLAQLFVEATDGGTYGCIAGDFLVAGLKDSEGMMGAHASSEWTLYVGLDKSKVDDVLDRLTARGGKLRDIVTAARDPESPAGKTRRAAIEQLTPQTGA